jgi:hypothetical protein
MLFFIPQVILLKKLNIFNGLNYQLDINNIDRIMIDFRTKILNKYDNKL